MLTYAQANEKLSASKRPYVKLGNNTSLKRKNGHTLVVVLYATEVVRIHEDGTYTFNAGGHRTATTKSRMNEYGPNCVYQKKGIWFVGNVEFFDGIRVNASGEAISALVIQ